MLRLPRGGGDDGGGSGQEGGESQQRGGEGDGGGEGADEEGAAGVAEFAADFGGAHGLAESFGWGGGGKVGESDRGDEADPDADQDRGGEQSGDAGYEHCCTACGGQSEPGGHAGAVADVAVVAGASGAGLDQGGGSGQQRDDRPGGQGAEASPGADDRQEPHPH